MKTFKEKMKSRKGFTLVELVVVIAVLAILAGVGAVAYRGYITRAQEAKDMEVLAAVKTAVDAAYAQDAVTVKSIKITTSTANQTMEGVVPKVVIQKDGAASAESEASISGDQASLYTEFMEGNDSATLSKQGDYTWNDTDDKWTVPPTKKD